MLLSSFFLIVDVSLFFFSAFNLLRFLSRYVRRLFHRQGERSPVERLHYAVMFMDFEEVQVEWKAVAEENFTEEYVFKLARSACVGGKTDILQLILTKAKLLKSSDSDVDLLDAILHYFDGKHYLLHYAASADTNAALSVSFLLKAGATLSLLNCRNQTAAQVALECGHEDAANLLLFRAKISSTK